MNVRGNSGTIPRYRNGTGMVHDTARAGDELLIMFEWSNVKAKWKAFNLRCQDEGNG